MSMDSTPPSKDPFWHIGLKRKIHCLQVTYLIDGNKFWLRVKGWKIYQANDP
jgi:hypothetical protein